MTRVAIIGSGPTGIYTLQGLISSKHPLVISVFEESPDPGKGTPYHPAVNDRAMLANIASIEIPPIEESLIQWLFSRSVDDLQLLGVDPAAIGEREYYPRIVLGEYFADQFWKLVRRGTSSGHTINVKGSCRISDIELHRDDIRVVARSSDGTEEEAVFDHVVMATGHDWPEDTETYPGYFVSPWPAAAIKRIGAVNVGVLGTSLSGIDAVVSVATSHGMFLRDEKGTLGYEPRVGHEALRITMMSRKGLLPEADFYCPIPYEPLVHCTVPAVSQLIEREPDRLLDAVFDLFKQELAAADPEYAAKVGLSLSSVDDIADRYFRDRASGDPFVWTAQNLAQAKRNKAERVTVAWRYAILRMHEVIARAIPHLNQRDLDRFHDYFKIVFVDDYATVPHESIERLLSLHNAGRLSVLSLGSDYDISRREQVPGVVVKISDTELSFDAFIDATGQHPLSASDIPFPSLRRQDVVQEAQTREGGVRGASQGTKPTGGIDVDKDFRPRTAKLVTNNLYCVSVPFLLHKLPFVQGITSAHEMGGIVSRAVIAQAEESAQLLNVGSTAGSVNAAPAASVPPSITLA